MENQMGLVGMFVSTGCMFLAWRLPNILESFLLRSLRSGNAVDHLYPESAMTPCIHRMEMLYAGQPV